MKTVSICNPGMAWGIAANIHFPPEFDASRRYPAIVSNHPIGSCKEQTAGNVYGAAMAEAGFVVIAPDASFQGGSGAYRDGMEIYGRAASKVKELVVIEGASHYELYDQPGPVGQALDRLVPFFKQNL